jgi:hypothetical protein
LQAKKYALPKIYITIRLSLIKMPTCKDCKFYTPVDEKKGICSGLGSEVLADRDAGRCPLRTFRPKN